MSNHLSEPHDFIQNITSMSDSYPSFTENNPERIACLTFSIVTFLLGLPSLYSIIFYEHFGSDKKRTLLNMLVSMICWTLIGLLIFARLPETFRFIYGPLPDIFCCFHNAIKIGFVAIVILLFDCIAIARYVFIFQLKNPAAFKDDFWCCFVSLWALISCGIFTVTLLWLAECKTIAFYICTGKIAEESTERITSKASGIFVLISIALHIVIYLRILVYKKKDTVQPLTWFNKPLVIKEIEKQSISSMVANLLGTFIVIIVIATNTQLNSANLAEMNNYPNYVFIYFAYLIYPNLAILVFIASSFRKQDLRKFVKDQIADIFYSCTTT